MVAAYPATETRTMALAASAPAPSTRLPMHTPRWTWPVLPMIPMIWPCASARLCGNPGHDPHGEALGGPLGGPWEALGGPLIIMCGSTDIDCCACGMPISPCPSARAHQPVPINPCPSTHAHWLLPIDSCLVTVPPQPHLTCSAPQHTVSAEKARPYMRGTTQTSIRMAGMQHGTTRIEAAAGWPIHGELDHVQSTCTLRPC